LLIFCAVRALLHPFVDGFQIQKGLRVLDAADGRKVVHQEATQVAARGHVDFNQQVEPS